MAAVVLDKSATIKTWGTGGRRKKLLFFFFFFILDGLSTFRLLSTAPSRLTIFYLNSTTCSFLLQLYLFGAKGERMFAHLDLMGYFTSLG